MPTENPNHKHSSSSRGSGLRPLRTSSLLRHVETVSSPDSNPDDGEHRNDQGRAAEQKHSTDSSSKTLETLRPHIEKAEEAEQEVINVVRDLITHYQGLEKAEKDEQQAKAIHKSIDHYKGLEVKWQRRLEYNTSSLRDEQLLKDLSEPDDVKGSREALDKAAAEAKEAKVQFKKVLEDARKGK